MSQMQEPLERVITGTGHRVHLLHRHAHVTVCGLPDTDVYTFDPLFDVGMKECAACFKGSDDKASAVTQP